MPSHPSPRFTTAQAQAELKAAAPRRVLIVDDEPMVRRVLARWFERQGWIVAEGRDGAEAVHLLMSGCPFNLVLCDHQMPRAGGPEIFTWVAANRPALVPGVVIMSGDVNDVALDTFVRAVGCRLVEKPFDFALLSELVDEVVSRTQAA